MTLLLREIYVKRQSPNALNIYTKMQYILTRMRSYQFNINFIIKKKCNKIKIINKKINKTKTVFKTSKQN